MMNRSIRAQSNFINAQKLSEFAELSSLEKNVELLACKNKEKYLTILSSEPNYGVTLYQPKDGLKTEKLFKKELFLKQLDKLMDQQNIFDKKITQINVLKELENQEIDLTVEKELNPYLSLRSAWSKHQMNCVGSKQIDRLESLNFTIGIIKNTVLAMKNIEEHHQPTNLNSIDYSEAEKYQKLQQKYERVLMVNEDLRQEILSLYQKLEKKDLNEKNISFLIIQKEQELIELRKKTEITEINHKISISELEQKIYGMEKNLENINKWKLKLKKNSYKNIEGKFKIYLETSEIENEKDSESSAKVISKKLHEIEKFLSEEFNTASLTFLNPEFPNCENEGQENSEIVIPTLSLTENSEENYIRRKFNTERTLKVKNFEFEKFVGKKLVNLKEKRSNLNLNINDETAKKFVRKNHVLGSNRQLDYQFSERTFENFDNQKS